VLDVDNDGFMDVVLGSAEKSDHPRVGLKRPELA
jgi:hypothetical protein